MYCIYCGKKLEGNYDMCYECAVANGHVKPAVQPDPVPAQAPATPVQIPQETFVLNTPAQKPPKKGGKGIMVAAIAAVAVVALVLVLALSMGGLKGFFVRTFGTPQDYMTMVEEEAAADLIDSFTGIYGNALENADNTAGSATVNMNLLLGDELLSTLEAVLAQNGMAVDPAFLQNIMLNMNTAFQDEKYQAEVSLGLGSKQVVSARTFMDMAANSLWVGLPEMSKEYLTVDISQFTGDDIGTQVLQVLENARTMFKALPSEKDMSALLNKYYAIVLKNLTDVSKDTTEKTLGGVTQKLNVITVRLHEQDAVNMLTELLTTLKYDTQAKAAIAAVMDYYYASSVTPEVVWDPYFGTYTTVDPGLPNAMEELEAWIDEGLEAMEEAREYQEEVTDDSYITLETLVDNAGTICGRTVTLPYNQGSIYYLTLWNGNSFVFEADLDTAQISGTGTKNKDIVNAAYSLVLRGMDMGTLELSNWDEGKAKEGYINGTVRLIPSKTLLNMALEGMNPTVSYMLASKDLAVKMSMVSEKETASVTMDIQLDNERFAGLTLSADSSTKGKVTLPTGGVDLTDNDASIQWLQSLDFDTLYKNMKNAGVPTELVDMLEQAISMGLMYMY